MVIVKLTGLGNEIDSGHASRIISDGKPAALSELRKAGPRYQNE